MGDENQLTTGRTTWSSVVVAQSNYGGVTHAIEGFTTRSTCNPSPCTGGSTPTRASGSALPGDRINIHLSAATAATNVGVRVYRVGYYGTVPYPTVGSGAATVRLFASLNAPSVTDQRSNCTVDTTKSYVHCEWPVSVAYNLPTTMPSGVYVARASANGKAAMMTFVVREPVNRRSRVVAVLPITTYEAYNMWTPTYTASSTCTGGAQYLSAYCPGTNMVRQSFSRPHIGSAGAGELLSNNDFEAIRFLETPRLVPGTSASFTPSSDFTDVSYMTNVDIDIDPSLLDDRDGLISLGHDEYWSTPMRNKFVSVRNLHTKEAFFGANYAYWRVAYDYLRDSGGAIVNPSDTHRIMTMNRVSSADIFQTGNEWDHEVGGAAFDSSSRCNAHSDAISQSYSVADSSAWAFDYSTMTAGSLIPNVVGGEWNRRFPDTFEPAGTTALATFPGAGGWNTPTGYCLACSPQSTCSPTWNFTPYACGPGNGACIDDADMTSFEGARGARVFSASTLHWQAQLDPTTGINEVKRITWNAINDMLGDEIKSRTQFVSTDFDCDGRSDVVALTNAGNGQSRMRVQSALGTGDVFGKTTTTYASSENGWDWNLSKVARGKRSKFTPDCYGDVAVLYRYSATETRAYVFGGSGPSGATVFWTSAGSAGPSYDAIVEVSVGDVDGDLDDDLVVLENASGKSYCGGICATGTTRLWVLSNTGTSFVPLAAWTSGSGAFIAANSKLAVGDVTGDGKADAVVLYNLGSSTSRLYTFASNVISAGVSGSTGAFASGATWWTSGVGAYTWSQATPIAGKFRTSGTREDVAVLYDNLTSAQVHVFQSSGSAFGSGYTGLSLPSFSVERPLLSVGNEDNANGDDIIVLHRDRWVRAESFRVGTGASPTFTRAIGVNEFSP